MVEESDESEKAREDESEANGSVDEVREGEAEGAAAPQVEEEAAMKAVEPIQATVYEKVAALVVLSLMVLSMVYIAYTVVLYWSEVGV